MLGIKSFLRRLLKSSSVLILLFFALNAQAATRLSPNTIYCTYIDEGEVEEYELFIEADYRYYILVFGPANYGYEGILDPKIITYHEMPDGSYWERPNTDAPYWMGMGFGAFLEIVGVPEGGPSDRVIFARANQIARIQILRQGEGPREGHLVFRIIREPVVDGDYYGSLSDWARLPTGYPGTSAATFLDERCPENERPVSVGTGGTGGTGGSSVSPGTPAEAYQYTSAEGVPVGEVYAQALSKVGWRYTELDAFLNGASRYAAWWRDHLKKCFCLNAAMGNVPVEALNGQKVFYYDLNNPRVEYH